MNRSFHNGLGLGDESESVTDTGEDDSPSDTEEEDETLSDLEEVGMDESGELKVAPNNASTAKRNEATTAADANRARTEAVSTSNDNDGKAKVTLTPALKSKPEIKKLMPRTRNVDKQQPATATVVKVTDAFNSKPAQPIANAAHNGVSVISAGAGAALKLKNITTKLMVDEAIARLNDRSGSSLIAIKKYIINNFGDLNEKTLMLRMKRYTNKAVDSGDMVRIRNSFKMAKSGMKPQTPPQTVQAKRNLTANKKAASAAAATKKAKPAQSAKLTQKPTNAVGAATATATPATATAMAKPMKSAATGKKRLSDGKQKPNPNSRRRSVKAIQLPAPVGKSKRGSNSNAKQPKTAAAVSTNAKQPKKAAAKTTAAAPKKTTAAAKIILPMAAQAQSVRAATVTATGAAGRSKRQQKPKPNQ